MTILTIGVARTPDLEETEWAANLVYADREPSYNIFIPRILPNERLHTTVMTGASPLIRDALQRTATVYVADTGQYLEDLPSNPTGLRVAFIYNPLVDDDVVNVEVRTGVDWDTVVERMNFRYLPTVTTIHAPSVDQIIIRNVLALPAQLDRSTIYNVVNNDNVDIHITGSESYDPLSLLNRTNLHAAIDVAKEAYSNIVRLDTRDQMMLRVTTATRSTIFVIADASVTAVGGDSTVSEGMAIYLYDIVGGVLTKVYEQEGSDLVFTLDSVIDKPANSTQLDLIERTGHTHAVTSQVVIDNVSQTDGYLVYNNNTLAPGLDFHIQQW